MSRFHEVRDKASGNDSQNDSAVGKCNFPVPLIELAQGKLATEGSRREIRFRRDIGRNRSFQPQIRAINDRAAAPNRNAPRSRLIYNQTTRPIDSPVSYVH